MFDFSKLKSREKFDWHYRCRKCKKEHVTWFELPNHMLSHGGETVFDEERKVYFRCYGILDLDKKVKSDD